MAKIDLAYSLELEKCITAIEAYDLYMNNILKDKRMFECCGDNCDAQITCVNMDNSKYIKIPHFKKHQEHTYNCSVALLEEEREQNPSQKKNTHKELKKSITFDIFNNKDSDASHNKSSGKKTKNEEGLSKSEKKQRSRNNTSSRLTQLQSLIKLFIKANNDDELDITIIRVPLGKQKKPFDYSMRVFFKQLNSTHWEGFKHNYTYVFYGKGILRKADFNSCKYFIQFNESFLDSELPIRCYIDDTLINNTPSFKEQKSKRIEEELNKELYWYVLGSISEKKYVYLNPYSLDHIAFSKEELNTYLITSEKEDD